MFDEEQLVEVVWASKTKTHFIERGYEYTKIGDKFFVKAKDLPFGSHKKIVVKCDYCGKEYNISYYDFMKRKDKPTYICRSCKLKMYWNKSFDERAGEKFDALKRICDGHGYMLLTDKTEYVGAATEVSYLCPKHGLQHQTLDNILHGHECFACSYEKRKYDQMFTSEYVKSLIDAFNGNELLNPEDYNGVFVRNLKIKCGECGDVYTTDLDSYLHKNQTRCKHCSQSESVGEFRIRKFFENNNIDFEQEKTFPNCKDAKSLPFDFYLPKYNLIIEFDGKHHFENTVFDNYEITKCHDEIKNQYCKEHNINIIRIPYWNGSHIEEILTKELNL